MGVGIDHQPRSSKAKRSRWTQLRAQLTAWGSRLNRIHSFLLGVIFAAFFLKLVGWGRAEPAQPEPAAEVQLDPQPQAPAEEAAAEPAPPAAEEAPAEAAPEAEAEAEDEGGPVPKIVRGEVKPGQFIARVLADAGVSPREADLVVLSFKGLFDFRKSRPGHRYELEFEPVTDRLLRFRYRASAVEVYESSRPDGEAPFKAERLEITTQTEVVEVHGDIKDSLYNAFIHAGESMQLAMLMTEALQYDVDFFHDTRPGDHFRLFVDKITADGKLVRYGRLHAAEYMGGPGSPVGDKKLYWFESGRTKGYFDAEGKAAARAFLRSPLKYTRISSRFGYRVHPILHRRHFHGGVDYAAPTGTPVHSVADGRVIFAGRQGAAGNFIKIQHASGYQSLYMHLSRILVRRGQHVSQNTLIGKVGSTGRSTGPHLDFRLKKNGRLINPRQHVAPRQRAIPRKLRAAFAEAIAPWRERLVEDNPHEVSAARP